MILILLFLFLKWLALPLTLCVYLTIFLYDKSSGNDEMPHGVCRCFTFPGVIFCVCDLNLVHSGWVASEHSFFFFFVTSCYQEDLKRSRMLWWDFPESSFKRAAILWPLPKTCPKVIFLLQHQFICLSYPFQLSSSVCLLRFGTIVVLYW